MKPCPLVFSVATACLLLLAGCETRSISNSGYQAGGGRSGNAFYHGELSELAVIGIDPAGNITDAEIRNALDSVQRVRPRKGSTVLLVQSGAFSPDPAMRSEMARFFTVVPFSGESPKTGKESPKEYAKVLRLAAAQGGCETIVCYWGLLESAQENYGTKTVSWVPVVGWMVPDEKQQMRIRLKVALVDVRTGNWTMFSPDPFADSVSSAVLNRSAADQRQVEKLKQMAYTGAVDELVKVYAN